jgi:hypothetical protein
VECTQVTKMIGICFVKYLPGAISSCLKSERTGCVPRVVYMVARPGERGEKRCTCYSLVAASVKRLGAYVFVVRKKCIEGAGEDHSVPLLI